MPMRARPLFVSTDPAGDPDDYWLLAHLAVARELDVLGVVTNLNPDAGERSSEYTAANARGVYRVAGIDEPPRIVAGAATPLSARGADRPERELEGARLLVAVSRGFSETRRLPVLVTGPATDVALALALDATLADRIEIVAMAFDRWPIGGDPWNVRSDVRAWQLLLASGAPLIVGDCEIASRDLAVSRAEATALLEGAGPLGDLLRALHDGWVARHPAACENATGSADAWPLWDEITLAHVLGFTRTREVERPALDESLALRPAKGASAARIEHVDAEALWSHLAAALAQGDDRRAASAFKR